MEPKEHDDLEDVVSISPDDMRKWGMVVPDMGSFSMGKSSSDFEDAIMGSVMGVRLTPEKVAEAIRSISGIPPYGAIAELTPTRIHSKTEKGVYPRIEVIWEAFRRENNYSEGTLFIGTLGVPHKPAPITALFELDKEMNIVEGSAIPIVRDDRIESRYYVVVDTIPSCALVQVDYYVISMNTINVDLI